MYTWVRFTLAVNHLAAELPATLSLPDIQERTMPKGFRGSLMIFSATLLLAFTNAAVVHADPAPAEAPKPAAAPARKAPAKKK